MNCLMCPWFGEPDQRSRNRWRQPLCPSCGHILVSPEEEKEARKQEFNAWIRSKGRRKGKSHRDPFTNGIARQGWRRTWRYEIRN